MRDGRSATFAGNEAPVTGLVANARAVGFEVSLCGATLSFFITKA